MGNKRLDVNLNSIWDSLIWFLVGAAFSVLLFWLRYRIQKPKLRVSGSGSSSKRPDGEDIMLTYVNIWNEPSFLGIRFDRGTAKIAHARLFDMAAHQYVGPVLQWNSNSEESGLANAVEIETGKTATVNLFAKLRYANEYFIHTAPSAREKWHPTPAVFDRTRRWFRLDVADTIGRVYKFEFVVAGLDQSVGVGFRITPSQRVGMIADSIRTMRRALFSGWPRK